VGPLIAIGEHHMKALGSLVLKALFILVVLFTVFYLLRWLTGWRITLPFGL
jgi:hypothetical protein